MSQKRWIEASSDATELERALIASGLDVEPPAESEGAVWQSLAATLGVPLPPPHVAASTAASVKAITGASALVIFGKGVALGLAVSLGLAGVARLEGAPPSLSPPLEPPHVRSPPLAVNPVGKAPSLAANPLPELPRAAAPVLSAEGASAEPQQSSRPARPPSSPGAPPALPRASEPRAAGTSSVLAFPIGEAPVSARQAELERRSQLEEEAALLRRARSELRANRLAQAFATLEASREKFSLPELNQEREALLIELLFQSGQRASAVEKARRFLVQYPNSPHAVQVRSIARAEAQ